MTADTTPDPDDRRASGPRRNTQFGQTIGVDDTSPPKVSHGQRVAGESRMVDDPYGRQRVRFVQPLDRRPPPQEASEASEYGAPEPGPPVGEVGLPVEDASAWDACKTGHGERGRGADPTSDGSG